MQISFIDWAIVVIYLAGVVSLGCWAGMNAKKKGKQTGESVAGDYFMAAHTLKCPDGDVIADACVFLISSKARLSKLPSPMDHSHSSSQTTRGMKLTPSSS